MIAQAPGLLASCLAAALALVACGGPEGGLTDEGADDTSGGEYVPPSPECDPLAQDCPLEQACYFVGGDRGFGCESPTPDSPGALGDACQFPSNCAIGLDCGAGEIVPGCAQGFGCCTAFCEVGGDPCPAGLTCSALYESGAPPGYENVGLCRSGA